MNDEALHALGEELSRSLGEGPEAARRHRQRARLIRAVRRDTSREPAPRRPYVVVAGALGLLLVAATYAWSRPSALTASSERSEQPVLEGDLLQQDDEAEALLFSDGSRVELHAHSTTRLATLSGDGVRWAIQEGRVRGLIQPSTERVWTFQAGPYSVRVLGTVLTVEWRPDVGQLRVPVERGRVAVTGGLLGDQRLEVGAGEELRVGPGAIELRAGGDGGRTAAARHEPEETNAEPEPEPEPEPQAPSQELGHASSSGRGPDGRAGNQRPADWRRLAREDRYGEALRAARAIGLSTVLARSNAEDLLLLGDAARLAGRGREARRVYRGLRRRHATSRQAAEAAFLLGRLDVSKGRHRTGARWFARYLEEAPRGAFATEARGRKLEALLALGQVEEARQAARDYLARHPRGPHRALAEANLR